MWNFAIADVTFAECASVPLQPQNLAANSEGYRAVLTSQIPSSDGGSTVTGYNACRGVISGGETLLASGGCANLGNVLTCTNTELAGSF